MSDDTLASTERWLNSHGVHLGKLAERCELSLDEIRAHLDGQTQQFDESLWWAIRDEVAGLRRSGLVSFHGDAVADAAVALAVANRALNAVRLAGSAPRFWA